ncbi:MAG: hypothetical protein Kow0026_08390 [Oricola sp.]
MNEIAPIQEGRQISREDLFRKDMERMLPQFEAALPEHIKPERYQRVVLTAVLSDPALLRADRKSLLEASMRAAQDGLLPDKREGAFVVFNTKVHGEWVPLVQWMPMIGGIIKKMHQSGDVAMVTAKVVYENDDYEMWVDDEGEHVRYRPAENPNHDVVRQVFAMVKTKEGAVYVEALTPRDIEKIRNVSRSKDKGPWKDWWEEMAKKSAIRRLAKRLHLSPEIHELIQRDNVFYDISQAPEPRPTISQRLASARRDSDAGEGFDPDYVMDETGEFAGKTIENEDQNSEAVPSTVDASEAPANQPPAGEEGGDRPTPPSTHLMEFAGLCYRIVADQEFPTDLDTFMDAVNAFGFKEKSPEEFDKAEVIVKAFRAVINDKTSLESAAEFIAEMLGASVDDFEKKDGK